MFLASATSQLASHACSSCSPSHVKPRSKSCWRLKVCTVDGTLSCPGTLPHSHSIHANPRRKPNFWLNILECGGNAQGGKASAPASHLKKSLTIKSRREDSEWLQSRTEAAMAAEIVMRSPVQLSALVSHSLWVVKTWHGILQQGGRPCSQSRLMGISSPTWTKHTTFLCSFMTRSSSCTLNHSDVFSVWKRESGRTGCKPTFLWSY